MVEYWRHTETGRVYLVTVEPGREADPATVVPLIADYPPPQGDPLAYEHVLVQGSPIPRLPDGDYVVLDPKKGDRLPDVATGQG